MSYTIIGNSAAAIGAIEAIREYDATGKIKVISDEPFYAYSRPLISYLLGGMVNEGKMLYRDPEFYGKKGVELLLKRKVICIDTSERKLLFEDGDKLSFDKLLIATGGVPIVPDIPGRDLRGVFTFTKWSDAKEIKRFIKRNSVQNALVVGGGLIGLKSVEALMKLGMKITVVELADRILSSTFDGTASRILEEKLRESDVEIVTENTVQEIRGYRSKVRNALLRDGREVSADIVIFAIGVRPNIPEMVGPGIEINRGISVDKHMRTSLEDIYAAGDVAEATEVVTGGKRVIAIWPNAYRQGKIAGYNMVGLGKEYAGSLAMNSVELCGIPTISAGFTETDGEGYEILKSYDKETLSYRKIVMKNNRIVGFVFVNRIERAGIFTELTSSRVDVSSFKDNLLKEDFGLILLPKEFRKHLVSGPGIEV